MLNRVRIVAVVSQLVTASVPQHVRVHGEGNAR